MKIFYLFCCSTVLLALANGSPDEAVKAESAVSTPTPAPRKQHNQGTVADRTRLATHLFAGDYNKHIIPDDVTVNFGIVLVNFDILAKKKILSTYFWQRISWNDTRLAWTPEDYGGISLLRYDPNAVWRPDITLFNSADSSKMISCDETNILIYSTGKVLWVPPCKVISYCPELTLHKEPYAPQTCSLKFSSWTYDGNNMNVTFYNNKPEIDASNLINSSDFNFISTTGERHATYYPCCEEPYLDLTFNMTVQRRPGSELEY